MNRRKTYALTIGISDYIHLRRLSSATNDAQDIASVIQAGAIASEVIQLLDQKATKKSILKELNHLSRVAQSRDTVIVLFSGHGGRTSKASDEAYFCPVEAAPTNLEQTALSSKDFTDVLRHIRSERLVVLLDTCYAGGFGEARNNDVLCAGLSRSNVDSLVAGEGRIVMAASRPDEQAWELPEMRNGLFTHYLLEALSGKVARPDGSIWASDVFSYVSRNTLQHRLQRPYQKAVGEDFVVILQKNTVCVPSQMLRVPMESSQRQLRIALRRTYNREELSLVCRDLCLSLAEDLPGGTLETQIMHLIDHCHRHRLSDQLLARVQVDHPEFTAEQSN
jgi:hypothetical protein